MPLQFRKILPRTLSLITLLLISSRSQIEAAQNYAVK